MAQDEPANPNGIGHLQDSAHETGCRGSNSHEERKAQRLTSNQSQILLLRTSNVTAGSNCAAIGMACRVIAADMPVPAIIALPFVGAPFDEDESFVDTTCRSRTLHGL